jgi:hypothetical protein
VTSGRCADLSEAAGEPLAATATHALEWLLVEVAGAWPRDVADDEALDGPTRAAISAWRDDRPSSRLLFIRRPGRASARRTVFVTTASETRQEVRRIDLEDVRRLGEVDLARDGDVVDRQLVLVCGHGTRDACCALRGRAVFGALAAYVAPSDLWLSSLGGRIALEHYRGRTAYTDRQQAAERVVRESQGLVGVSDLRLVDGAGDAVRFVDQSGNEHRAVTQEVAGPPVPASCGAVTEPQKHVAARLL